MPITVAKPAQGAVSLSHPHCIGRLSFCLPGTRKNAKKDETTEVNFTVVFSADCVKLEASLSKGVP
jgi:hypothetical protein